MQTQASGATTHVHNKHSSVAAAPTAGRKPPEGTHRDMTLLPHPAHIRLGPALPAPADQRVDGDRPQRRFLSPLGFGTVLTMASRFCGHSSVGSLPSPRCQGQPSLHIHPAPHPGRTPAPPILLTKPTHLSTVPLSFWTSQLRVPTVSAGTLAHAPTDIAERLAEGARCTG